MEIPALVASDLDGTLLHTDNTVSARTLGVLDMLAGKEIPFVMVTGRPMRWVPPVLEYTGARGVVVCSNGAVIWDPESDRVLSNQPLTPELMAEVVWRLRDEYEGVAFAAETATGLRHERTYQVREIGASVRPGELAEVIAEPAIKLLVRLDGAHNGEFTDALTASLAGLVEVTRSGDELVEISASGVTKATGLAWVAERLGVAADAITAFGDMPNDLPMFAYVGHSVAMANAEPAIRTAADAVTAANDDDGVAVYLESLLS